MTTQRIMGWASTAVFIAFVTFWTTLFFGNVTLSFMMAVTIAVLLRMAALEQAEINRKETEKKWIP